MQKAQAVVIDNGSGFTKAGFAGSELPLAVIPSIIGRPPLPPMAFGSKAAFVGSQVQSETMVLKYPIEHGLVTNWEDLETLWQHVFSDQLKVASEAHPVMLTESPQGPKASREKMTEAMFETFQVPAMYVALQGILALYQSGHTTGLVVESGDGVSHAFPVWEGYALPHALLRFDLGGRDVTDHLRDLLASERGYCFSSPAEHNSLRLVKEKLAYAALDYEEVLKQSTGGPGSFERSYELPDGSSIVVGNEAFRCTEAIFQPSLLGRAGDGLVTTAYNSAMRNELDLRGDLFGNVLLTGGNTMFPGFVDRFTKDLAGLASRHRLRVIAPSQRHYAAWTGGSMLAALDTFDSWVTKAEYAEYGPPAVHRKCF